ncbi:twin-arginine translocase subunit TatC [Jatrophihabitans sp. YIM 134969]
MTAASSSRVPRRKRTENPEARMSVIEHLRELRRRLIVVLVILALGGVAGWFLYDPVLEILKAPYCSLPASSRLTPSGANVDSCALYFRAPVDGFTIRLKVSLILGAIFTTPLWLYQIWAFVTPGLKRNEKKYTYIFLLASTVLFLGGVALAYGVLYKGLAVLIGTAGSGVDAALDVTSYINFVVLLMLIFGAAFELPLLLVMLNVVGVLPFSLLKRGQRIGIFLIFLFAAVATPTTDPFTMCAMAVPMVILFEGAVLFSYVHDKRKAARKAQAAAEKLADDEYSRIEALPEPLQPQDTATGGRGRDDRGEASPGGSLSGGSLDDVL